MPGDAHSHWIVGYALPGGKLEAARGKAALSFYDFKQPINRVTGKAATLKNAHLFGFFGRDRGWRRAFFSPDFTGSVEFLFARCVLWSLISRPCKNPTRQTA